MYLIIATICFAIQIYFDFNAYSTIAKGSAKIMGYDLSKNFNMPYFATSIKDFWRRWHISLSSWFKEYIYFPLGGSKKGFLRTQINTMIVFLISGLWHGAAWTFVIWGALHGLFQVIENIFTKYLIKIKNKSWILKTLKIIVTFLLVCFAWIFFRANSLHDAFTIVTHLFDFGMVKDLTLLGTNKIELIILFISTALVFIVEFLSTKVNISELFKRQNIIIRWLIIYLILFGIIIFGIYGPGFNSQEFIYFQF